MHSSSKWNQLKAYIKKLRSSTTINVTHYKYAYIETQEAYKPGEVYTAWVHHTLLYKSQLSREINHYRHAKCLCITVSSTLLSPDSCLIARAKTWEEHAYTYAQCMRENKINNLILHWPKQLKWLTWILHDAPPYKVAWLRVPGWHYYKKHCRWRALRNPPPTIFWELEHVSMTGGVSGIACQQKRPSALLLYMNIELFFPLVESSFLNP
jgi:hypothetical protein